MQEKKENLSPVERAGRMQALYQDLMQDYKNTVQPWGLGYDMPEDVSAKASGIMDNVFGVMAELNKLNQQAGIETQAPVCHANASRL